MKGVGVFNDTATEEKHLGRDRETLYGGKTQKTEVDKWRVGYSSH